MYIDSFVQFELWKDCNNGCKFCYNNGFNKVDKISNLNYFISILPSIKCQVLGISGGEFFSGQIKDITVKEKFNTLINIIANKIKKDEIKKFFINTSLMFDRNYYFIPFIKMLKTLDILNCTMFCTSYDSFYRFNNHSYKLWLDNMNYLTKQNINRHIETILTQHFMEKILKNKSNPYCKGNLFNCKQDFLEAHSAIKGKDFFTKHLQQFLPKKSTFISFLKYLSENDLLTDEFLSPKIRSNTLYFNTDNGIEVIKNRHFSKNYFPLSFSDSDDKVEDVISIFKELTTK